MPAHDSPETSVLALAVNPPWSLQCSDMDLLSCRASLPLDLERALALPFRRFPQQQKNILVEMLPLKSFQPNSGAVHPARAHAFLLPSRLLLSYTLFVFKLSVCLGLMAVARLARTCMQVSACSLRESSQLMLQAHRSLCPGPAMAAQAQHQLYFLRMNALQMKCSPPLESSTMHNEVEHWACVPLQLDQSSGCKTHTVTTE